MKICWIIFFFEVLYWEVGHQLLKTTICLSCSFTWNYIGRIEKLLGFFIESSKKVDFKSIKASKNDVIDYERQVPEIKSLPVQIRFGNMEKID